MEEDLLANSKNSKGGTNTWNTDIIWILIIGNIYFLYLLNKYKIFTLKLFIYNLVHMASVRVEEGYLEGVWVDLNVGQIYFWVNFW